MLGYVRPPAYAFWPYRRDHEAGAIGPRLFEHVCKMGSEGIISKHRERGYRAGRSAHWIKVKTRSRRQWFAQWKSIGLGERPKDNAGLSRRRIKCRPSIAGTIFWSLDSCGS